jgi:acetylornithine/succinyldiaminopimelate/putrescine aminotransferase
MRRVSAYLFERLHELKAQSDGAILEIRGAGHFVGIDLAFDAAPVVPAALERGLLVNRTSTTVVRLLPPFIITEQHVDEAIPVLRDAIGRAKGTSR